MNEFLRIEYEQCLSLLKYYDERHNSLVKYASGMSSAIPTLLLAIYQLGGNAVHYFWQFTLVISLVTTLGLLSIFTVLIQTRLYFIYPVRQVNSIRRQNLKELNEEGFENQMYLSTSFSAFKWFSSHTLLNLFVAAQAGIFAGLSIYSYLKLSYSLENNVSISTGVAVFFTLFLFGASALYLYKSSKYHPDKCIHRESVTQRH